MTILLLHNLVLFLLCSAGLNGASSASPPFVTVDELCYDCFASLILQHFIIFNYLFTNS